MNTIIPNILEFEGNPFINALDIVEYNDEKGKLDYHDLGKTLRLLRKTNRNIPIIQFENTLLATRTLKDDSEGSLAKFEKKFRSVKIEDFKGKDIIRRLIGELIAVQLRNSKDYLWKVEERRNNVFEASDSTKIQRFGDIEIYPGFTFSPIVLPNGKAGVILDLKHKFYSIQNLRDRMISGVFNYSDFNTKRWFVDTCPLSMDECAEKRDSFSSCEYAGTGKSLPIIEFLSKKPSEVYVDSKENLIQYHERKDVCLKSPHGLANRIRDNVPVAISEYVTEEGENYTYPIERLREIPSFEIIENEEDRKKVMKLIRPDVFIRFRKTILYMRNIKEDSLGNDIRLKPIMGVNEWVKDLNKDTLQTPQLRIGNSMKSDFPSFIVEKHGFYDEYKTSENLFIKVIYFSDASISKIEIIMDIFRIECSQRITSFYKYSKIKTEILEPTQITSFKQLENLVVKLKEYRNLCVLLVHSKNDINLRIDKHKVEKLLIEENIPKQGINLEDIMEKLRIKQNAYLRNIYLGIFAKMGHMAWILDLEKNNNIYVGFSSKFYKNVENSYRASLCFYDNQGRFLKGKSICCSKNDKKEEFGRIFENLNKDFNYVIMKHGRIWETEYIELLDIFKTQNLNGDLYEIVSSPLRIYFLKGERVHLPTQGTYMFLSDSEIGLVTTRAMQGTRDPILIRKVFGKPDKMKKVLHDIFSLTQCYTGWEKYTTKFPVPVHASDKVLQKSILFDLESFEFEKAWFV